MTFSLLGRCARTGMTGGVMATSSIAAAARVMFGDPDLGVVFVQARSDPRLAPVGVAALKSGATADAAVVAMAGAAGAGTFCTGPNACGGGSTMPLVGS